MSSLKKNFSIAKLYSDLQKYEQNITGFKDSRLKKQSSGSSMYQRPTSTNKKNYELRENYQQKNTGLTTNIGRFEKNKWVDPDLSVIKMKGNYYGSDKYKKEQKSEKNYESENLQKRNENKDKKLLMRGGMQWKNKKQFNKQSETFNQLQNKRSSIPLENKHNKCYNKNDQLYFLTQCFKLYELEEKQNIKDLGVQQEADVVKKLISQINKRDKIYQIVTKKLGVDRIQQRLNEFFNSYSRLERIINQFKKMSKLQIDDQKELYEFLMNEQTQIEGEQNLKIAQTYTTQNNNQLNDIQK